MFLARRAPAVARFVNLPRLLSDKMASRLLGSCLWGGWGVRGGVRAPTSGFLFLGSSGLKVRFVFGCGASQTGTCRLVGVEAVRFARRPNEGAAEFSGRIRNPVTLLSKT